MLAHALKSIGKGTRPAITILSSKFHDHDPASPRLMACAVELLHIATLVHDDTIDKAAIRRGKPTISKPLGRQRCGTRRRLPLRQVCDLRLCHRERQGHPPLFRDDNVPLPR